MEKGYKKYGELWKYSKKQDKFCKNVYYQNNMNYNYLNIDRQIKKSIYLGEYYLEIEFFEKISKKDKDGLSFRYSINLIHYATKKVKTYHHMSKQTIENWYLSMRRFCLWIGFDKYYRIIQVISDRTSSVTHKIEAQNKKDPKFYFAKVLDCTRNPMKEILDEIKINQSLRHESIPEFYGAFFENNKFILIFEYFDGINLQDYINANGKLPENKAAVIIECLITALDYLNHCSVVHRDIKLKNVLICDNGFNLAAKLINFRFAKEIKHADLSKIEGTPGVYAPGVLEGNSYDGKSDIYGLGIILYTILTTALPFDESTSKCIKSSNRNTSLTFTNSAWNFLSIDAQNLIKMMTIQDPSSRYTPAQCLSSAWLTKNTILFDCTKSIPVFSGKFQTLITYDQPKKIPTLKTKDKSTIELEISKKYKSKEEIPTGKELSKTMTKLFTFEGILNELRNTPNDASSDESDIIDLDNHDDNILNKLGYFCSLPIKRKPI